MAAFRLDLIGRYLRPHRRTVLLGAVALVIVNMLSVTIPLEVRRVIDDLQDGFAIDDVLRQAGWIVLLATSMGVVRLISRQLVFGVGRQVEVELRQQLFDHMLVQEPGWVQETGSGEVISRATSDCIFLVNSSWACCPALRERAEPTMSARFFSLGITNYTNILRPCPHLWLVHRILKT